MPKPAKQIQLPIKFLEWPRNTGTWSKAREENLVKILCKRVGTASPRHKRGQGEKYGHVHSKIQSPQRKKVTHCKIVYKMKPEKEEKERTRFTVGGNLLDFTGNISAPIALFTTAKCVFNSVVSTPGARCLLAEIKHFYLNNILPDPEFMRIPLKTIPQ